MPMIIGTSGWQYAHWRERFYPKGVPQRLWLEHYAERFDTVEVNNAFYMLPKPETFEKWRERTPEHFIVGTKMNRYVTHIRRLRNARDSVDRFFANARKLGPKLGPVLLQLPPNLKLDAEGLADTLDACPNDVRISVEFRHPSWYVDEVHQILAQRNAALCLADREHVDPHPAWCTADWGYVRFHEGAGRPHPCYKASHLEAWVDKLGELYGSEPDVYVYFNNDPRACALRDAIVFSEMAQARGLRPTKVPQAAEVSTRHLVTSST